MKPDIKSCYLNSPLKSIKHSTYFASYEKFFSEYRNKKITFIEIGVLGGGSLIMWRNYFGPKARIIGVDINPNAKKMEKEGFEIFIGNQSDENFWKKTVKKIGAIDIVLDDGGHTYEQQIITTESLLNEMNDGGIIVIEDTHSSYMNGYGPKKYSFVNYVKNKIDQINYRYAFEKKYVAEKRIHSIEVVESMVAFKINRLASNEVSEITSNNGKDDLADDLRYIDNKRISYLKLFASKLKFLSHLPFLKFLYVLVTYYFANRKFNAKKYFCKYK
jgi:cephalosporin hydroxylase